MENIYITLSIFLSGNVIFFEHAVIYGGHLSEKYEPKHAVNTGL
jgi:hypothetical protein